MDDPLILRAGEHLEYRGDAYSNRSGAGYKYEEDVCRDLEKQISADPNNINLYKNIDWSFDPNNMYQGKNW